MSNFEIVAKAGGTTMAEPERFAETLEYPGNQPDILVVSAPGPDPEADFDTKLTDMLRNYSMLTSPSARDIALAGIQERCEAFAARLDPAGTNKEISQVLSGIVDDVRHWHNNGWPVMGLGEYWSARIFAAATDREFVDARDVIRLDHTGTLDTDATYGAVRSEFKAGHHYVAPGFYGADRHGRVHLAGRNSSDLSGAAIARPLRTDCHIYSDVDGLHSSNPSRVSGTTLQPETTYNEMCEMSNGGCELVHGEALRHAEAGEVAILLRNSRKGPAAPVGTVVTSKRDNSETPIIGVTARNDLIELRLHERNWNEKVNSTTWIFDALAEKGIPYENTLMSCDDVSVILQQQYQEGLPTRLNGLAGNRDKVSVRHIGSVGIVGEGLAASSVLRSQAVGKAALALSNQGIGIIATGGAPNSVASMLYIDPEETDIHKVAQIVHDELCG